MKFITFFFALFLLSIILLADFGYLSSFFQWLKSYFPFYDKAGHFVLFGSLAFFVNVSLKARTVKFFSISFFAGSLLIGTLITAEEFSQIFIASRHFEWLDLLSNYAGIITFSYFVPHFVK